MYQRSRRVADALPDDDLLFEWLSAVVGLHFGLLLAGRVLRWLVDNIDWGDDEKES